MSIKSQFFFLFIHFFPFHLYWIVIILLKLHILLYLKKGVLYKLLGLFGLYFTYFYIFFFKYISLLYLLYFIILTTNNFYSINNIIILLLYLFYYYYIVFDIKFYLFSRAIKIYWWFIWIIKIGVETMFC